MAQELRGGENRRHVITARPKVSRWYYHPYTFLIDLEFDESAVMVSIRKQRFSALNSLIITLQAQLSVTTVCSQLSNPYSLLKALYSKLYSNLSAQISLLKFLHFKLCARIQEFRHSRQVSAHSDRLVRKCLLSKKKSSLSIASFQNGVTEMEQFHTLWRPAKRSRRIR